MTDFRQYKTGDKVFSVIYGIGAIYELGGSDDIISKSLTKYPLKIRFKDCFRYYTYDGFYTVLDKYPELYTLENAKKMGFDVPKEKLKATGKVTWMKPSDFSTEIVPVGYLTMPWPELEGKTGILTFEFEEE